MRPRRQSGLTPLDELRAPLPLFGLERLSEDGAFPFAALLLLQRQGNAGQCWFAQESGIEGTLTVGSVIRLEPCWDGLKTTQELAWLWLAAEAADVATDDITPCGMKQLKYTQGGLTSYRIDATLDMKAVLQSLQPAKKAGCPTSKGFSAHWTLR